MTIIHLLMIVMTAVLLPSFWLSAIAGIILLASFIYYCRRHQWINNHRAIIKVERDAKQQWKLFYSDKLSQEKLVLKHCVVTSTLVILYFLGASRWKATSVTILADAVDVEQFRQLRVYCRDPKVFLQ